MRSRLRRVRWPVWVAYVLVLLVGAGFLAFVSRPEGDFSNPGVEFEAQAPPAPPPPPRRRAAVHDRFTWPVYGYTKARTRWLPASRDLRPPFRRRWALTGSVLLEFPPVLGGRSLYLLKNNGALYAVSRRTGRVRWRRKLGYLAASSPAYAHGTIYAVLLARYKGIQAGRVVAITARSGRTRWSRKLPSRAESSPLVDRGTLYFGTENGTVYALRARDGYVRWRHRARGAVKAGLALDDRGRLFFGDYAGRVTALRAGDGAVLWSRGTDGLAFGSGNFYSTPAVSYGRVYLGNTDGRVYSFAARTGQLAWAKRTGGYVYASPAVAAVGGRPTVYIGSYDGRFYALDARTGRVRWSRSAGGRISGAATVVGDVVYFSVLASRSTIGLGARTGTRVFRFGRGAFNPVVSDGRRIYVTGYASLYALEPDRGRRRSRRPHPPSEAGRPPSAVR